MSDNASVWETVETNLVRYKPAGTYYVKAKVGGKKVRESLGTDNLAEARKLKANWLARVRGTGGSGGSKTTFAALAEIYKREIERNRRFKPRTVDYKLECLEQLRKTWPGLYPRRVHTITKREIISWRDSCSMSAGRVNGQLTSLREVFELAEDMGLLRNDPPTTGLKNLPPGKKLLVLPSEERFEKFRGMVQLNSAIGGRMFDLLQLSGARIDSARNLHWRDVDFERGVLRFMTTKRDNYSIPLFEPLKAFLLRIRPENWKPSDKVVPVQSIKRVLETTSAKFGMHITHHTLRHWFATRCIESGVDIPTLARWLGHKDGGALAMRTYGHWRDEHDQAQAAKVK